MPTEPSMPPEHQHPVRLAAAELVCALYGITAAQGDSDRQKAATQAWMDWMDAFGPGPQVSDELVRALARRRDATRAATLRRLFEPGEDDDAD